MRIPVGFLLSYRVTESFQRGRGVKIGRRVRIIAKDCKIGDNVQIGAYTHLYCRNLALGNNVRFQHHVEVSTSEFANEDSKLTIESNAEIFTGTVIDTTRSVKIGENVGIGGHCRIWTHGGWEPGGHLTRYGNVEIKRNAWLAWDIIVLPNVTIGEGAVIGAGSVVTKDVPDYAISVGNPARIVKTREISH